jgi:leucyl-tRNA synthetase
MTALWPESKPVDEATMAAKNYVDGVIRDARLTLKNEMQPKKKKGAAPGPVVPPTKLTIFVADKYPEWQSEVIDAIRGVYSKAKSAEMKEVLEAVKNAARSDQGKNKKLQAFVKEMRDLAEKEGVNALDRRLKFDEKKVLNENLDFIKLTLEMKELSLTESDKATEEETNRASLAVPGNPAYMFKQ